MPSSDKAWLAAEAERVLRANWREGLRKDGVTYGYTCPSRRRYKHQWLWDSCFHAIVWARIEPARGREELRTLLRAGRADGHVPHTAFWGAAPGWRRAPFYATHRLRGDTGTASIGPPLIAIAWEIVAAASHDAPDFAAEGVPELIAHHARLEHDRDPDGDGLLSIVLPDESGLDDSPKYDPVFGRHAHWRPGYFALVERCRRASWDAPTIIAAGDLHVEDVLVNVAWALSNRALGRLSGDADWMARAQRAERALVERCWDERRGLFFDLAGRDERRVEISTWSSLAPLALGDAVPEEMRRRLVEEHLLDPRRYGAPCGIPSVSMDEPSFRPGWDRMRTWRGASWANVAWLLLPGVRELGYDDLAERIVASLTAAARRSGLREYYDALSGRGAGARDFGWSALLADLRASTTSMLTSSPATAES